MNLFSFDNKRLRSIAIAYYMRDNGYDKAVCFSCGNASRELRKAGVDVLDISPTGDLQALRWFTIGEVHRHFPTHFDATSGHLPMDCMKDVAWWYKSELRNIPDAINLPTGSGETLVCLKMAFPESRITAVYDLDDATRYEKGAPLNPLVLAMADRIVFGGQDGISTD
jgi:hypothetical protein